MAITLDRNLSGTTNTELKSSQLVAVPLLYLDFPSLVKYYAGSNVDIVVSSSAVMPTGTYQGVAGISSVAVVEESIELRANSIVAELNGLDNTYIALVLGEQYYGRDATLGLAVLDSDYQIVGEPIILFKGFMSVLTADIDSNSKITVELESILSDWERPRLKRYNSSSQDEIDSSDEGFSNVDSIVNKEITWG